MTCTIHRSESEYSMPALDGLTRWAGCPGNIQGGTYHETRIPPISLAAGLGFAIAATQAFAQQPGFGMPMAPGGMMGMMQMMVGCPMIGMNSQWQGQAFGEGRIAFLKAELAITDAQEAAWDAYAAATRANLQSMQGMMETMRTAFDAKTPLARLDAHLSAMEARVNALKDVKPLCRHEHLRHLRELGTRRVFDDHLGDMRQELVEVDVR
jgi:LTXXQ motif family protein